MPQADHAPTTSPTRRAALAGSALFHASAAIASATATAAPRIAGNDAELLAAVANLRRVRALIDYHNAYRNPPGATDEEIEAQEDAVGEANEE